MSTTGAPGSHRADLDAGRVQSRSSAGPRRLGTVALVLVRAFGAIDIEPPGGTRRPVTGRRPRLILALLVARAGELVGEDSLAEAIWGDDVPRSARTAIQTYISGLRDLLDPGRARHQAGDHIVHEGGGYRLDLDGNDLDLARFAADIAEAAAIHHGDRTTAERRLDRALGLWVEPPLAEFADEPWALAAVAGWREQRAAAIEARVGLALDDGNEARVGELLRSGTRDYPYRERLAGQLMLAHYRAGDQRSALAEYSRIRRALRDDLGVEPGRELRLLEQAILDHDPALQRRDRAVVAPGPTTSTDGLPTVRRLIGRDEALDRLDELLASERCVAIVGPGGVGKTTLGVAAAQRFRRRFDAPVVHVDLARHRGRTPMRAIATSLRIVEHPLAPLASTVADALGAQPTLLLLETCEVAPDEVAAALAALAGVPGLRTLLTSQVPTGAIGEYSLRLGGLSIEDGVELLRRGDRAGTPEPDLAAIVEHLGGLPLALELAAGRLSSLGADELLRSLDDDRDVLSGADARPARQRSVRAAADWSVSLLDAPSLRLLAQIAGFSGPFTMTAASALLAASSTPAGGSGRAAIGDLVDRSLVERVGGDGSPTAFAVPDDVAAAIGDIATDAVAASRTAVAELVLAAAQAAFAGTPPPGVTVIELGAEVIPALRRFEELDDPRGLFLAGLLGSYFQAHGLVSEGREHLTRAIERFSDSPPVFVVAAAAQAGFLAWYQGDARACQRQLDEIDARLDQVPLPGFADIVRGCRAFSHGDHPAAARHLHAATEVFDGATPTRMLLLNFAGNTAWYTGQLDLAERRYREQGEIAEDVGDDFNLAQSLRFRAMLTARRPQPADLDRAWRWAERSRRMSLQMSDPLSQAQSAAALAVVATAGGDLDTVSSAGAEAVQLARRQFDVFALRTVLPLLAERALDDGRTDEAAGLVGWYLDLLDRTGQGPSMAVADLAERAVARAREALGPTEFARLSGRGAARSIAELADDVVAGPAAASAGRTDGAASRS